MSRRALWIGLFCGSAALALLLLTDGAGGGAAGSTLSRGASGWHALVHVLRARDVPVQQFDRPLDELRLDPRSELLVMILPWQRPGADALESARRHLQLGGQVLIGYSGARLAPGEDDLLAGLAVGTGERAHDRLSLWPWQWRREVARPRSYRPTSAAPAAVALLGPPLPRGPVGSADRSRFSALFEDGAGLPAVVRWQHPLGGTLWLLPAATLSNAWLGNEGNALLLDWLIETLPSRWVFDEYHHGLSAPDVAERGAGARALDVVVVQCVALYLLVVLALAWRWAPPWPHLPTVAGSHRDFLLGVGRLHTRLGREAEAAEILIDRVESYERGLRVPESLRRRASRLQPHELLAFAREVAALQHSHHAGAEARTSGNPDGGGE